MKLAWLTDIHLNFLDEETRKIFYQEMISAQWDAVLISGDIAEATSVGDLLTEMAEYIQKPIYFVLGNHDYYRGSVTEVRQVMADLTKKQDKLFWLPASGIQDLSENIILLGQDGWADGRLGDYQNSRVSLNDSQMIADLSQAKKHGKFPLLEKMQELADVDAAHLQDNLDQAVNQNPKKIIVLTHVPPFKESCFHMGKMSEDEWLPYFSSKISGDILLEVASKNSSIEFLVLCGHTHSESYYQPMPNLTIKGGKAEYYYPQVQEIIAI